MWPFIRLTAARAPRFGINNEAPVRGEAAKIFARVHLAVT